VLDAAQLPSADSIVEKPAPAELVRHSCRVLVCADGAVSGLARSLQGLTPAESPASVIGPANSIGGRAFAKRHTHDCRADEVIFYPQHLLPGHLRMSGELDDYLNITCFVLPHPDSGSQPFSNALSPNVLQEKFVSVTENEPWIRTALGPRCKLSRLQTAPLRVGGVPRSYFPNGMIVGDAAGHQDPLTGDGIQYGMQGARLASKTIIDAFRQNDFSLRRFKQYEKAWKSLFGWDFFWAKGIMYFMAQFPRLIDAVIVVIQRKGSQAILFWALARSGVKSKMDVILWFLRPDTFWEIVWRWISLWAQQEF
jgi:menaquinone-9 beta-reductase